MSKIIVTAAAILIAASQVLTQSRLETVFSSDLVINGPTVSPDGRLFTVAQPASPGTTPEVVEIRDGKPVPYPDEHMNSWKPGMDGHKLFVGVNSIRIGPDGALWIVDRGGPGIGKPLAPGGPKLMKIDFSTNKVARIYDLASVTRPWSFVDDVRFNRVHAYLTDAGPGLIILDLETGKGRRVLDGHPSTVAQTPLIAEGKTLRDPNRDPINIHADQLAENQNASERIPATLTNSFSHPHERPQAETPQMSAGAQSSDRIRF